MSKKFASFPGIFNGFRHDKRYPSSMKSNSTFKIMAAGSLAVGLSLFIFLAFLKPSPTQAQDSGSDSDPNNITKESMELKLEASKKILEGIVREDFKLIALQAARLKQLSQSASWQWRQSDDYKLFTSVYRRSADKLFQAAQEKNLDLASLEYFQLTTSCVNCHQYMRETRLASEMALPEDSQLALGTD